MVVKPLQRLAEDRRSTKIPRYRLIEPANICFLFPCSWRDPVIQCAMNAQLTTADVVERNRQYWTVLPNANVTHEPEDRRNEARKQRRRPICFTLLLPAAVSPVREARGESILAAAVALRARFSSVLWFVRLHWRGHTAQYCRLPFHYIRCC